MPVWRPIDGYLVTRLDSVMVSYSRSELAELRTGEMMLRDGMGRLQRASPAATRRQERSLAQESSLAWSIRCQEPRTEGEWTVFEAGSKYGARSRVLAGGASWARTARRVGLESAQRGDP